MRNIAYGIALLLLSAPIFGTELDSLCTKKGGNFNDSMTIDDDLRNQTRIIANKSERKYLYVFDGEISCGLTHIPFRSFGYDFKNICGLEITVSNKFGWYRSRALNESENSNDECKLMCSWKNPDDCKVASPSFTAK